LVLGAAAGAFVPENPVTAALPGARIPRASWADAAPKLAASNTADMKAVARARRRPVGGGAVERTTSRQLGGAFGNIGLSLE
jgi:hypothetical protein